MCAVLFSFSVCICCCCFFVINLPKLLLLLAFHARLRSFMRYMPFVYAHSQFNIHVVHTHTHTAAPNEKFNFHRLDFFGWFIGFVCDCWCCCFCCCYFNRHDIDFSSVSFVRAPSPRIQINSCLFAYHFAISYLYIFVRCSQSAFQIHRLYLFLCESDSGEVPRLCGMQWCVFSLNDKNAFFPFRKAKLARKIILFVAQTNSVERTYSKQTEIYLKRDLPTESDPLQCVFDGNL